jgi:Flp pilus assembly protein TadG
MVNSCWVRIVLLKRQILMKLKISSYWLIPMTIMLSEKVEAKVKILTGRKDIRASFSSNLTPVKTFAKSTSGNTLIMFAFALPAMLGTAGIAIDFSTFTMKQQALQTAADQAAIAGAKELALASSKDPQIKSAALSYLNEDLKGRDELAVGYVSVDRPNGKVHVEVSEEWTPFFAHFIGADITPVKARATASLVGSSSICVLTLNASSNKSFHMDKSARLTANGCGVYSDSTDNIGLTVDQSAALSASLVCSAGGVKQKGTISPAALTDCPVVADPLSSRAAPSFGSCDFNNFKISSGTQVLSLGVYCGGLEVSGSAVATLKEGDYIIKDGPLKVSNTASFTGDHVGFYLTGNASLIDFSGTATISLSGSTTPEMSGLLFFEDRATTANHQHKINSTNVKALTGTIYLSRGYLYVSPNAVVAEKSAYTAIIADRLELTEGPELILNSNYTLTDVPVPAGIRSSASVVLSN